jgi:NAD(P)-dependent dehydrogenase (short-subunit alcohol dehydrogenase family)
MAASGPPLEGKVALITGASRGIGRDVAIALAEAGADIVVASRSETVSDPRMPGTIYTVAGEIEKLGRRALPVRVDVTKDEEIEQAIEKTRQTFGRLDILMNNAAIQVPGNVRTVQPRHVDLIYRVDLRAPIMCVHAAVDLMSESGGGHIVNISSRAGVFPGPGPYPDELVARMRQPFYAMAKAGLERWSQALAIELQAEGIAVNVLSPEGRIRTPGNIFFENDRDNPRLDFEVATDMGKAMVWICQQDPRQYTGHILFDKELVQERGL